MMTGMMIEGKKPPISKRRQREEKLTSKLMDNKNINNQFCQAFL